ncbi:hypothetical protein EDF64_10450 [Curtobacterium flaccumfaciens]|uniref:Uncharacterized protein n=1 Tax=Curtobacterium flaccumfaciens TaxID=2035 RepID=A0A4R6DKF7_9MICO|nr:hypothetical protein [Curtobacterium flaccumfaciens]TDN44648.1 hypothetical protein EDF64_10450 [Curtobacterium flaccumfaciens]
MNPITQPAPRHRATDLGEPPPRRRSPLLRVVLWSGRALLVVTAVAVVSAIATRGEWARLGVDADGFPVAWLPNGAVVVVLITGVFWPWLLGIAAPPGACWREGDVIVAPTVLGQRRVRVSRALVLPYRGFTQLGTVHGAVVLTGAASVLVLLGPIETGGRSQVDAVIGRAGPTRFHRVLGEWGLGALMLLLWLAGVFVLVGAALAVIAPEPLA